MKKSEKTLKKMSNCQAEGVRVTYNRHIIVMFNGFIKHFLFTGSKIGMKQLFFGR